MIPGDFLKMKIGDIKKINFQNNQKYFQEKKSENNPLKNIGGSNSEDFLNENNLNLSFNNLNNKTYDLVIQPTSVTGFNAQTTTAKATTQDDSFKP